MLYYFSEHAKKLAPKICCQKQSDIIYVPEVNKNYQAEDVENLRLVILRNVFHNGGELYMFVCFSLHPNEMYMSFTFYPCKWISTILNKGLLY